MIAVVLPISLTPALPVTPGDAAQTRAIFLATLSASVSTIVPQSASVVDVLPDIGVSAMSRSDPAGDAIALAQSFDVAGTAFPEPTANVQIPWRSKATGGPKMADTLMGISSASVAAPSTATVMPRPNRSDGLVLEIELAVRVPPLCTAPKEIRSTDSVKMDNGAESLALPMPTQAQEYRTLPDEISPVRSENAMRAAPPAEPERLRVREIPAPTMDEATQSSERVVPATTATEVARPKPLNALRLARSMLTAKQQRPAGLEYAALTDECEDKRGDFVQVTKEKAEISLPTASPLVVQTPIPENVPLKVTKPYRDHKPAQAAATGFNPVQVNEVPVPSAPLRSVSFVRAVQPELLASAPAPSAGDSAMPAVMAATPAIPKFPLSADQPPLFAMPLAETPLAKSPSAGNDPILRASVDHPIVALPPVADDQKAKLRAMADPVSQQADDAICVSVASPVSQPPSQAEPATVKPNMLAGQPESKQTESRTSEKLPVKALPLPDRQNLIASRGELPPALTQQPDAERFKPKLQKVLEIAGGKPADGAPFVTIANTAKVEPIQVAIALPSLPPVESRQLDLARNEMWLDQLAQDIVSARQDNDQLSFRLTPENLGRLDVKIDRYPEGLSVQMVTTTAEAHAVITAAQPRLVEELKLQGTRLVETQVRSGDAGWGNSNSQSQRNGQNAPQPTIFRSLGSAIVGESADDNIHSSERFA